MSNRVTIYDETRVPLKWVFLLMSASGSALLVAVSVGIYAAKVEGKADFAALRITALESEKHEELTYLRRIEERLSRMEGKMDK